MKRGCTFPPALLSMQHNMLLVLCSTRISPECYCQRSGRISAPFMIGMLSTGMGCKEEEKSDPCDAIVYTLCTCTSITKWSVQSALQAVR